MVALFAFAVTIGSTYAWFTITNEDNVQSMSVTVEAQESLLIMMDDDEANDGTGWNMTNNSAILTNPAYYVTTLTNSLIQAEYDFTSLVLQPVTTLNGTTYTWRDGGNTGISGTYAQFNVWVLSQTGDVSITIQDLTVSANNAILDKNAVVQAARLSIADQTAAKIFGLGKDYTYSDVNGFLDSGSIATISALHGDYFLSEGTGVSGESTTTLSSATTAFSLVSGTPKRITIRIWIEGWDGECTNNLSAAKFAIGFKMAVK